LDLIVKAKEKNPNLRISVLCSEFNISKSTFYRAFRVKDKDSEDYELIKYVFEKHKQKVGIRQLKMLIEREFDLVFNHKKIARIKRKYQLETKIRRKNKYRQFIKKKQEHEVFPNLLNRNFNQKRPSRVYSTDITEVRYKGKKAYIAAVKDLCTKEIVSKEVSNRIDIKLTNSAMKKALKKLSQREKTNLLVHSDQGMHFTHKSFRELLRKNNVTQSMSRKGNCIDNAPIESFFGTLKDHLDLKDCKTIEDVKNEVTKQINYYNHQRPQLALKKMPPSEYRRHFK
jgi:transposase InsO family protein